MTKKTNITKMAEYVPTLLKSNENCKTDRKWFKMKKITEKNWKQLKWPKKTNMIKTDRKYSKITKIDRKSQNWLKITKLTENYKTDRKWLKNYWKYQKWLKKN